MDHNVYYIVVEPNIKETTGMLNHIPLMFDIIPPCGQLLSAIEPAICLTCRIQSRVLYSAPLEIDSL